jgi:glycosyltransferase involved in cell wall biosynthesis
MKKKLLITTDNFLPRWDGIARFLHSLIPTLQEDFEITVVCPAFEGETPSIPGVKIIRLPLMPFRFGDIFLSKFSTKRIRNLVRQHDVVFNQALGPIGVGAILAASKLKRPVISYVHSVEWELVSKSLKHFRRTTWWTMKLIVRWLYNKCNLLLVPSQELDELLTMQGITTKKQVVQLGIDTSRFIPPVSRTEAKRAIGVLPSQFVITYVGRLAREKNIGTLYTAFQHLRKDFPNVLLLIVGSGVADGIKPSSRVLLLGQQNNVVPYYQASDIYVLPSLTETTSLTTLEAMACGCAVLVTPVGSVREYIEDGKNGLIFPRRDARTLADLLKFLLLHEETRKALGVEARKTVEEKRSWKNVAVNVRNALVNF